MWSIHTQHHAERKNDEGRNEPSLQNQRLQNGYKEEKDEYYILEIRNGVFMESLQIHSLKKKYILFYIKSCFLHGQHADIAQHCSSLP